MTVTFGLPEVTASAVRRDRAQTRHEEAANAVSHGIGFLMSAAALHVLLSSAMQRGHALDVVGAAPFGTSMMLMCLVCTLYHAVPACAWMERLGRFDHAAIYLFIAGSYMPFLLGLLRGGWGWSLFGAVWTAAFIGVVAKLRDRLTHPLWSTALYVAMGWVVLVAAAPLVARIAARQSG